MSKCKYCDENAEDCTCKKLRLLLRFACVDYNAVCVEHLYKTAVVFVVDSKDELFQEGRMGNYEIIGGEWLRKEVK